MRRIAVIIAALWLCMACTQRSGAPAGTPSTSAPGTTTSTPRGTSAQDLLGEFATLDPCSLVDPSSLERFGRATVATLESLEYCGIDLVLDGRKAFIAVGALDVWSHRDIAGKPTVTRPGGLKMVNYDDDPQRCTRMLVFSDQTMLRIGAFAVDDDPPDVCPVVTAAAEHAAAVIERGEVAHRDFPARSLGLLDACGLLPEQDVIRLFPALDTVTVTSHPARHNCVWESTTSINRVNLEMNVGSAPVGTQYGGTAVTIAGRPTVLTRRGDAGEDTFCWAETTHIPFHAPGQPDLVEIAALFIRAPGGQLDQACAAATSVAAELWPKLPA